MGDKMTSWLDEAHDKRERILIVDDKESVLASLYAQLLPFETERGFKIDQADDGESALALIAGYDNAGIPLAAVLTDIVMHRVHGDELLKQVAITHPYAVKAWFSAQRERSQLEGLEAITDFSVEKGVDTSQFGMKRALEDAIGERKLVLSNKLTLGDVTVGFAETLAEIKRYMELRKEVYLGKGLKTEEQFARSISEVAKLLHAMIPGGPEGEDRIGMRKELESKFGPLNIFHRELTRKYREAEGSPQGVASFPWEIDEFDLLPTTRYVIAKRDGQIIGGMRAITGSLLPLETGTLENGDSYSLTPKLRSRGIHPVEYSRLILQEKNNQALFGMMNFVYHAFKATNPVSVCTSRDSQRRLYQAVGFVQVAGPIHYSLAGEWFILMRDPHKLETEEQRGKIPNIDDGIFSMVVADTGQLNVDKLQAYASERGTLLKPFYMERALKDG